MNTKIIYISGGANKSPAEIQSALDTVRAAMGYDADTLLFGVPLEDNTASSDVNDVAAPVAVMPAPVADTVVDEPIADTVAQETNPIAESESAAVISKPKRTRKKNATESPILSVISSAQETETNETETPQMDNITIADDSPNAPISDNVKSPDDIIITESITDIITADDDGEDEIRSIEDIFAGIAPIAEDEPVDITSPLDENNNFNKTSADTVAKQITTDTTESPADFDATLGELASEFLESDAPENAPAARGTKIGKLKNILPFKKKEKTGGSMLGDLFGWAGVAANDDDVDFAMPDFFKVGNI